MHRLRYAALGAALAYFFDPQNGRERRKHTIKRLATMRRGNTPDLAGDLVDQARETAPAHD